MLKSERSRCRLREGIGKGRIVEQISNDGKFQARLPLNTRESGRPQSNPEPECDPSRNGCIPHFLCAGIYVTSFILWRSRVASIITERRLYTFHMITFLNNDNHPKSEISSSCILRDINMQISLFINKTVLIHLHFKTVVKHLLFISLLQY